jgi:hypothetical protein
MQAISFLIMPCHGVSCRIMSHLRISCLAKSHLITSCHRRDMPLLTMSCHVPPCYVKPYLTSPCQSTDMSQNTFTSHTRGCYSLVREQPVPILPAFIQIQQQQNPWVVPTFNNNQHLCAHIHSSFINSIIPHLPHPHTHTHLHSIVSCMCACYACHVL